MARHVIFGNRWDFAEIERCADSQKTMRKRRMLTSAIQTRVIDFQRNKVNKEDSRAIAYISTRWSAKTPGVWILQTAISIKDRAMHCDKRGYGRTHAVYNAILSTERYGYVKYETRGNAITTWWRGAAIAFLCEEANRKYGYLSNIFFHNRRNRRPHNSRS